MIRHAKSSWSDPSLADFERPLNKRGTRDAPRIASALSEHKISFDKLLCSDARRARQTLDLLKRQLAISESIIEYRPELYGATSRQLKTCITEQDDSVHAIALLGHNPGLEELANDLSNESIGSMPTCCVVQVRVECVTWNDLRLHSGKVVLHLRPREL